MHSTTMSTSTPSSSTSSATTANTEQYHYPPISTLRRASRPSNIDLSTFDHHHHHHHHTQQSNDPGIYSAPICYLKPPNHHHQQNIQQSSHPYTATFQYQPQPQQQHMQLPSHHHPQQQANINLYQQQQQQQQQQQIHDPFAQHQHTPHTFPLQASPNHYHQYFYFPPSTLQGNVTSNGHSTTNSNRPSTPTHNNRLRAVQIQEQQQQQWSNAVLSPLMVKRMNENPTSIPMDDDEDPSASIDALVADVDSNSQDLLDNQQNKSLKDSKTTSTAIAGTRSPSPHIYLRSTSHILTTPPNPLASDDHPDNQLTIGNNFQKTFSPISSAGFEIPTTANTNHKMPSSNMSTERSYFNFDANILEQTHLKSQHNDDEGVAKQDKMTKSVIINPDVRTTKMSSNQLIQDDSSSHSSTNSSCHNPSSRLLSQILQSSEQRRINSSSPLSADVKLSSLDPGNNNNQTGINPMSLQQQQQQNRHYCAHPDCNKIFANKSALAKHKLTHSQDRKHKCHKCNKGFKRLDHLHGHMLTHEEEKPHKCRVPNCNRTYCDARSLKRHIENSHQDVLAAIHEGGHDNYKDFLPDTAFVKTKDLSINSEFSIDSVDSNSPRSTVDNEQSFTIRTSTGSKIMTTYTFDEEKYVECQICKKTFKSGAALNGHMRLHGGFNEKQPSPSSVEPTPKKKRPPTATTTKRKRSGSPSILISIKKEEQDVSMSPSTNNLYHHHQQQQQQSLFSTLPSSSNAHQQQFYDRTLSSRPRSASSSVIATPATLFPAYTIRNPSSVQPPTKQARKQTPLSTHGFDQTRINITNGMIHAGSMGQAQIFPNPSATLQHYDEKTRRILSSENYSPNQQMNGIPSHYTHIRSSPHQHPSNLSQIQLIPPQSLPSNSLSTNLLHRLFQQKGELLAQDFYQQQQASSSLDNSVRYTPPPPPPSLHFVHSSMPNSTSSIINTPVTSPYSNVHPSHSSPVSSTSMCNNHYPSTIISNGMQPSPATRPTSFSSASSSSSSSHTAPKKRYLNAIKQEDKQQKFVEDEPSVLTIIPDLDSPEKKQTSGFLIGTPSSTGTSSSSSTSSHTHFNYENILPPPIQPPPSTKRESTPSSFQWPSQFRRQLSLNTGRPTLNPPPSTPYTPPPMLSPFRKGPGLYYRVFSQPGSSGETPSIPTTPGLPFTPGGEESTGPKINIGNDHQAIIPKLRTHMDDNNDTAIIDELLFSPLELSYHDETSLEKFEQLNRLNPFLFSPRHSSASYPLELVYMLLHEYNGNLSRTLASLLEGTAKDIKQCRPLHRYRFPECDTWTKEEIDAFTKAIQTSEKNLEVVSRAVGTKTVKQCVEFYYMPKVNIAARKLLPTGVSSVMTRRKRCQLIKSKQQHLDDETSSSSFTEFHFDDDSSMINSDSPSTAQFSCDIDECSQTFTTDRACRAHRKSHRRIANNIASLTSIKRSRNVDSTK